MKYTDYTKMDFDKEMRKTIRPRPLSFPLHDYWTANAKIGDLAYQWEDKPHRLVNDLIAALLDAEIEIAKLKIERDDAYREASALRMRRMDLQMHIMN